MEAHSIFELTARLKAEASRLGFDAVGIAPAVAPPGYEHYRRWLSLGHAAGMDYLLRHADAKSHPENVQAGVRSIVAVMFLYGPSDDPPLGETEGRIARYARGEDYHKLLWSRLDALLGWLKAEQPDVNGRAVADTAPLLERDYARAAGLGWIGKNTMLINRKLGSYTVLGALLVDCELAYDPPHASSHCGNCTRCLDACPTDAFVGPYQLDARRCLSYWTIEHKGVIPPEVAEWFDDWAFGCDICQEVCPWNRKAPPVREPALTPRAQWVNPDLLDWLDSEPDSFCKTVRDGAMARAKRAGLVRNAALILGQRRECRALPALTRLLTDEDPGIRSAAAWAIERIGPAVEAAVRPSSSPVAPPVEPGASQPGPSSR